jgi:hypothetical protein
MLDDTTASLKVRKGDVKSPPASSSTNQGQGPQVTTDDFFAPAYHSLIKDKRVSHPAFRLWCVLHMLRWNKESPTVERLQAEMAGNASAEPDPVEPDIASQEAAEQPKKKKRPTQRTKLAHRRSIEIWLTELEQAGWITWHRGAECNTRYHLHAPPRSAADQILTEIRTMFTSGKVSLEGILQLLGANLDSQDSADTPLGPLHQDHANQGSHVANLDSYDANQGSHVANLDSYDANQGSHVANLDSQAMPAQGVPMRQKTGPKKKESSKRIDSKSSIAPDDDDAVTSGANSGPPAAPPAPVHTESSRYLAEKGVAAALEFRDLPLHLIERTWHDVMGRDSSATPGAVVIALRAIAAARAAAPPPTATIDNDELPLLAPPAARAVGAQNQRMAQLWQATMEKLQARLPGPEFDAWLHDTALLNLDGGVATILVSTAFHKESLENRYLAPIRRALGELLGAPVQARVVADPADLP